MKTPIFYLFVATGTCFILLFFVFIVKLFPEFRKNVSLKIQLGGKNNFNLSSFQYQYAFVFGALHYFIIVLSFVGIWLISHNPLPSILIAAILYVAPRRWFIRQRKKRILRIESELPDALLFLASALRAGSSLSVALEVLVRDQRGPLGEEFSTVLREQRLGLNFDDAVQNMSDRLEIPDFVLVVVAMRISKQVGGNLSEPLQILATTLRRKAILEGRITALTAQGKIQGLVMTLFPFLLLGILYFIQPSMKLLFTTNIGLSVMTFVCVMLFFGNAMIKKIIAIDI